MKIVVMKIFSSPLVAHLPRFFSNYVTNVTYLNLEVGTILCTPHLEVVFVTR